MDATIKQQWIDALRSGTYPQARHALRDKESYCCLGVLCELYRQAHSETSQWDYDPSAEPRRQWDFLVSYAFLGLTQVYRWAGLNTNHRDNADFLIQLNDGQKKSFAEIAHELTTNPRFTSDNAR